MSKNTIFAFLAGAAIGAGAMWLGVKNYYESLANQEIDDIREYYRLKILANCDEPDDPDEKSQGAPPTIEEKPDIMAYAARLKDEKYVDYSAGGEEKPKVVVPPADRPYVISPEEFGEVAGYIQISLTYYADNVLADDGDFLVENIDEIVGEDSLNHFGEYEDDSVFVRNDARRCDYEILKDVRRYADILADKPYKAGM